MSPTTIGIIGIIALLVFLFIRMPVGFVMAMVGFVGFGWIVSFDASLNLLAKDMVGTFASYNLTVIPLFVLMGQLAFYSGISSRLFDAAYKWIGHLPGGLAVATIGACAGFATICGSTNATAATIGAVALPEMKRYNYKPILATGVVAAGGSLGILIPPSVIFIIYGILTEQSIGKLFMAGILPGLLLATLFILTIVIWVTIKPDLGPRGPKTTFKEKIKSLSGLIETLIIFVLVMGGLFAGIFTPTEAGALGAFFALIVALIRRNLSWKGFLSALSDTTRISCMIMVIVAGATVFGHFLAVSRIPYDIASWISSFDLPPVVIMCFIIFIYLIGGCFMDSLGLIMLTIPIFFPVVMDLGYDPIWFGVIIVLVTEMGVVTPPVGPNVYVVSGIARDVPLTTIFKGIIPFLMAMIVATGIILIFPQIATFLPSLIR
jgi:tripartite ATP-independent transporter DctM subunit